MSAIIILLSVSLLIALGFLIAFLWSVNNGQLDDQYAPAHRILFEKKKTKINHKKKIV